ncbi:uncharacterized protein RBU33_024350 isoform 1-T1 [Hipposideros larvatus]
MSLRPFLPGPRGEFGTRSLRLPHSPDAAYCSGRTGIACTPSSLEPIAGGPRGRDEESAEFRLFAAPPPPPPPPAEETAKDTLRRVERPGARPQSRFATGGSAQPRPAPPPRARLLAERNRAALTCSRTPRCSEVKKRLCSKTTEIGREKTA